MSTKNKVEKLAEPKKSLEPKKTSKVKKTSIPENNFPIDASLRVEEYFRNSASGLNGISFDNKL